MQAQLGNRVKVQFVGKLEDGTVFSEAVPEKPLEFTLGQEEIIPGFEEAIQGMEPGQNKIVRIPPEKGFGAYDPEKLVQMQRNRLAKNEPLKTGMKIGLKDSSGREFVGRVDALTATAVTLDLNHPLAGKQLQFDIRLQQVT